MVSDLSEDQQEDGRMISQTGATAHCQKPFNSQRQMENSHRPQRPTRAMSSRDGIDYLPQTSVLSLIKIKEVVHCALITGLSNQSAQ